MNMAKVKYEDLYLGRAKLVMKFLGVWIAPDNESAMRRIFRFFMIAMQYIFLIFQFIYIIEMWGDLDAVSEASYLLFTQACLCFKITVFQAARIKRLLLAFMVSSQTTCGLWALKPLFDNAGIRAFPFDMWMPVSPRSSPQYELGYGFQLVTICMSAYIYFGVDSVALSMVIFGCAQVDIVKDKIMSIKSISNGFLNKELIHKVNYSILKDCVIHHQAIVKFTELVENAFHTYLMFQISGSVGLFCMSAFLLLVVEWQSMQFFSVVSYLLVMISQLYLCCWCGHELTATSEDLHDVLYNCLWYEQNVKFRRALHFTMLRVHRPMTLRAGRYVRLSRETFVTILRLSYSYFAVLNSQE